MQGDEPLDALRLGPHCVGAVLPPVVGRHGSNGLTNSAFISCFLKNLKKYLRDSGKMLIFAPVQWNEGLDKSSSFLL